MQWCLTVTLSHPSEVFDVCEDFLPISQKSHMLSTKIVMLQDFYTWLPLSHDKCFLKPLVIFKNDIGSLNYKARKPRN